jgi:uncharacterized protein YndB with AHSA1/START domain
MMIEPIRASVTVECAQERAFHVFTEQMGAWWPLDLHSIAVDDRDGAVKAEAVVVEGREGGRIYEVMSDGAEGSWGTILAWEPPSRLVIAWKPNTNDNPPTELEIRFTPRGERTRVDLEHRGWERLGELAKAARTSYGEGWVRTLERYSVAASTA